MLDLKRRMQLNARRCQGHSLFPLKLDKDENSNRHAWETTHRTAALAADIWAFRQTTVDVKCTTVSDFIQIHKRCTVPASSVRTHSVQTPDRKRIQVKSSHWIHIQLPGSLTAGWLGLHTHDFPKVYHFLCKKTTFCSVARTANHSFSRETHIICAISLQVIEGVFRARERESEKKTKKTRVFCCWEKHEFAKKNNTRKTCKKTLHWQRTNLRAFAISNLSSALFFIRCLIGTSRSWISLSFVSRFSGKNCNV